MSIDDISKKEAYLKDLEARNEMQDLINYYC